MEARRSGRSSSARRAWRRSSVPRHDHLSELSCGARFLRMDTQRENLMRSRLATLALAALLALACPLIGHAAAAAGTDAHAATASGGHTTQTFPPLWNEPKDYEQALRRQLAQVDARVANGPFEASWS